jgi:hypothetical protein
MSPERKKERGEKMPFIVATYVYASSQGQRTHSARTNCLSNLSSLLKITSGVFHIKYKSIDTQTYRFFAQSGLGKFTHFMTKLCLFMKKPS